MCINLVYCAAACNCWAGTDFCPKPSLKGCTVQQGIRLEMCGSTVQVDSLTLRQKGVEGAFLRPGLPQLLGAMVQQKTIPCIKVGS